MAQKESLNTIFLRLFVKELIKNIEPSPLSIETRKDFKQSRPLMKHSLLQIRKPMQKIVPMPVPKHFPTKPISSKKDSFAPQTIPGQMNRPITQEMHASLKPTQTFESFPRPEKEKLVTRLSQSRDIGKLNMFLKDPRVQSIECPGPNKNVLVRKNGVIQKTKLILTAEDIKNIIQEFSIKTRIPLIEGTFKAAFGNLIMTAVISEFVGSRFVLQKKNPFQPLINSNEPKYSSF